MPFITVTYPPKYPLTEAEKKWLGEREVADAVDYGAYSCPSCGMLSKLDGYCVLRRCPRFDPNFEDAAEFEARVAAWMADNLPSCDFCKWYEECFPTSCARTRLKYARLAVEAEMEEDR
jgi:hypothetical protein